MRAGQSVTYVDAKGRKQRANITAVTGSGPSGYKLLDLEVSKGKFGVSKYADVVHERDEVGRGFWK